MVTASPPVSPSVVARILMIQKPSVICGTLATRSRVLSFISTRCRSAIPATTIPREARHGPATRPREFRCCREKYCARRARCWRRGSGRRNADANRIYRRRCIARDASCSGRTRRRLIMIVRDPKPAVAENRFIRGADAARIHDGAKTILAAVNAGKFSGALFDALNETRGLIDSHGAAGIVAALLEIAHGQDATGLSRRCAPV